MKKLFLASFFLVFTMYSNVSAAKLTPANELAIGSAKGSYEMVVRALENGADPNTRDVFGKTPIFNAAIHGHDLVVRLLLANGADVDSTDILGRTALHRAAMEGNVETVKVLLENGATIDPKDDNGLTPLERAAGNYHVITVDYLMSQGAVSPKDEIDISG